MLSEEKIRLQPNIELIFMNDGLLTNQTRFVSSIPTKEIYLDLIPAWVLYKFRIAL